MDTTISPNVSSSSKSNLVKQQISHHQPDFLDSINELRDFSTALSAFLHDFDDLRNHISSISSAIDAQLPRHLLLNTTEAIFSERNPNGTEKSNGHLTHANNDADDDARKVLEETNDKLEGIDVLKKKKKKKKESDSLVSEEDIDVWKMIEDIDCDDDDDDNAVSKKKKKKKKKKKRKEEANIIDKINVLLKKEPEKSNSFRKAGEIDKLKEDEGTDISKEEDLEIDVAEKKKKHEENDVSKEDVEIEILKEEDREIDVSKKKPQEIDISKEDGEIDLEDGEIDMSKLSDGITISKKKPKEIIISKKQPKKIDMSKKKHKEIDIYREADEIRTSKKKHEEIHISKGKHEQIKRHEEIDKAKKKHEEIDILKMQHEETDNLKKKDEEIDISKKQHGETDALKSPAEVDVSKKPQETDASKKLVENDILNKPEEIDVPKEPQEETDASKKPVEIDILTKPKEREASKEDGEDDTFKRPAENDASKKPQEETDASKKLVENDILNKPEEIDVPKEPQEETDASQKPVEIDILNKPEEIDVSKKPQEETDASKKPVEIDVLNQPEEVDVLNKPEEIDVSKKPDEIDVSNKPEEIDVSNKPEEIHVSKAVQRKIRYKIFFDASKKNAIPVLESLCKEMCAKKMQKHVLAHISEMNSPHQVIAKALKLAINPAKLVLDSIGRFFLQSSRAYSKHKQIAARQAKVLILECFVMISGDGIEITKEDKKFAENAAINWRKRMIKEGGLIFMEAVDARGLLLYISGFGIPDGVFSNKDIRDLIRASNVKEISNALRHSPILIPKLPEVIDWMVKNNLEIEAADIAYTFKLEDKCQPETILMTFLNNKIKDTQNGSSLQVNAATMQQLSDLKSLQRCLETHKIDPSKFLPGVELNEKIEQLEKVINELDLKSTEEKSTLKRKEKETEFSKDLNHQQAKRNKKKKKKQHEENDVSIKADEIDASKKPAIAVLEFWCKKMCAKKMKKHVRAHISEMNSLHQEIAKALKLAINPAKLVLDSIGRFFLQTSRASCYGESRQASVLILECFVMISGDGIEITKEDKEYAENAAIDWRKRMIKEGGLIYMEAVDARGLLLFISGFGIPDGVFSNKDIRDLIRASNVKEISNALRHSTILIPKLPEVIDWMVKNNLEIEAADIAYTFGLEDKCHPETILMTFLNNKIKDTQNGSSLQVNAARMQQLSDLKSIQRCLETHKIDPSKFLAGVKVNEKIEQLEKVINELDLKSTEEKSTLKRKEKETEFSKDLNRQQAKSNGQLTHANNDADDDLRKVLEEANDKLEGIDVLKKKGGDSLVSEEDIDIWKMIEDIDCDDDDNAVSKKKKRKEADIMDKINVLLKKEPAKSDSFRKAGEIDKLEEDEGTDISKEEVREIDVAEKKKKHEESELDLKLTEEKSTLKRKEKETKFSKDLNHQQAKRICFSHEQNPHDHYGIHPYNRSTQPSRSYFDRNLPNNYVTTYSASYVFSTPVLPPNITSSVPGGLSGSYLPCVYGGPPMAHTNNPWPYGGQPYSRQSQPYPSTANFYGRPPWRAPAESSPDHSLPGGFFGRRVPSSDLYRFADTVVERGSHHNPRAVGSRTTRSSYLN